MASVFEVVKKIQDLNDEFKDVTKSSSRDDYEKFGWKCINTVSEIDTSISYTKEDRFALKNALLNLKSLALRLGMFKEYLDTYVDKKVDLLDKNDKERIRVADEVA